MRILCAFLALAALFVSCRDESNDQSNFDYMNYERNGTDQIEFEAFPTSADSVIMIKVSEWQTRDTSCVFFITETNASSLIFDEFYESINLMNDFNGTYVEISDPALDWVHIDFVVNGVTRPTTNETLRATMMNMENIVRQHVLAGAQ